MCKLSGKYRNWQIATNNFAYKMAFMQNVYMSLIYGFCVILWVVEH